MTFSSCLQAKSTGELSIITFAANFLGGLARIFTSLQEGGGASMARAYTIGAKRSPSMWPVQCRWLRMIACADLHARGLISVCLCAAASLLNATIVLQICYYARKQASKKAD